jgi:type IV secretion system protein VirB6
MVFIAFIINMLFIPSMTQAIFGGAAGLTSAAAQVAGGITALALKAGAAGAA